MTERDSFAKWFYPEAEVGNKPYYDLILATLVDNSHQKINNIFHQDDRCGAIDNPRWSATWEDLVNLMVQVCDE